MCIRDRVVYSPMVAEPQEYQYNADAFEARGVDEVKQEAGHKEAPKVREDTVSYTHLDVYKRQRYT